MHGTAMESMVNEAWKIPKVWGIIERYSRGWLQLHL
jgi:hypothetical protein